jgi:hypothetical protein
VDIVVKNAETNELLPDCQVRIYNEIQVTDASGMAEFNDVPESFILDVSKEYFVTIGPKQLVVYSDTLLTVYLTRNDFDVTIRLFDKNTLDVFSGVNVTLGSETKVTGESGEVAFTVYPGEYNYLIEKINYSEESGILHIISDTTIDFYLTRVMAYIKFWITEGLAPVDYALVRINGDSIITTTLGLAHFRQLPVSVSYNYTITKPGYYDITGELFLAQDTIIYITMETWTEDTEEFQDVSSIKIWPNPVRDFLYLSVPDVSQKLTIRITDLMGKEIHSQTIENNNLRINIRNFVPGMYILKLHSSAAQTARVFIKN